MAELRPAPWLARMVCALLLALPLIPVGSSAAQTTAGDLTERALRHLHGEGVEPDAGRAIALLCAAAHHGYGEAAYELGWLYLHGRGVAQHDGLAQAWLREAQQLGVALPDHLAAGLGEAPADPLACVTPKGQTLPIENRRQADLVVTIYELAPQYRLDPGLVLEVVRAESNFDPRARSHKGALGLMQLIPSTARRFGVKDPFEPLQNLRGGMAYLRWLLERFDGDLKLTLAGYNAGEAAVERHGGVPPYAETRDYVRRILLRYSGQAAEA